MNQLERRIVELCREDSPGSLQSLLASLGATERVLARSLKWTKEAYLRPLHSLRPDWIAKADDGSVEFRLAQSVAATRASFGNETLWFREHLEPLGMGSSKERSWVNWAEQQTNDVAWHDGDLTDALNDILTRRLVRVERSGTRGWPDWSPRVASLNDIAAFIERRTNDTLLADLIWGLSLVDWERIIREERESVVPSSGGATSDDDQRAIPSSFYALLRLCLRRARKGGESEAVPLVAAILHRAIAGDGAAASELAARRLRGSGQAPLIRTLSVAGDIAQRTAAAMLFPVSPSDFSLLERMILQHQNQQTR